MGGWHLMTSQPVPHPGDLSGPPTPMAQNHKDPPPSSHEGSPPRLSPWSAPHGGWTNPFEKYARQIGSFPPRFGVKIKNMWDATNQIVILIAHEWSPVGQSPLRFNNKSSKCWFPNRLWPSLGKAYSSKKNGHRAPDNMREHLHPPKMQGGQNFNRDSKLQTSSSSGLKSFKDVADL